MNGPDEFPIGGSRPVRFPAIDADAHETLRVRLAVAQDERNSYMERAVRHNEERDQARAEVEYLRAALTLIAAPRRPDGTWNRDREACRQIAVTALETSHGATIDGMVP